ncbi:MAG: rhamnan synthesis F family protein [Synechococcaceae cyanobacterium]|nr:rhamnan synthesis F family protein [Synechococcaceae cyanobacterium]
MRKLFAFPKRLIKYLKIKVFILIIYITSVLEVIFSPWGLRGGLESRLRPLPAEQPGCGEQPRKLAVFVAYSPRLTLSTRAYIETLAKAGFAILYICNCAIEPASREALRPLVWRLYERRNLGRDVGAFRDGVLLLEKLGLLRDCQMLAIANDSMQFLPGANAESLVKALQEFESSDDEGLFSHISHTHATHYQSYFQVIKNPIIRSPQFLRFWREYWPLSHRGHCIYEGEIALSTKVYRHFSKVRVLYTSEALQSALSAAFAERGGVPADEILRLLPSPARTVQRRKVGYALDQILRMGDARQSLTPWQLYCVADLIENSNPSHVAAFLYPIYLQCPLVKQDLCVGGTFSIAQCIALFREALEHSARHSDEAIDIDAHVEEFSDVIYAKGTPMSYSNKPRESALKGITGGFVFSATYDGNL